MPSKAGINGPGSPGRRAMPCKMMFIALRGRASRNEEFSERAEPSRRHQPACRGRRRRRQCRWRRQQKLSRWIVPTAVAYLGDLRTSSQRKSRSRGYLCRARRRDFRSRGHRPCRGAMLHLPTGAQILEELIGRPCDRSRRIGIKRRCIPPF